MAASNRRVGNLTTPCDACFFFVGDADDVDRGTPGGGTYRGRLGETSAVGSIATKGGYDVPVDTLSLGALNPAMKRSTGFREKGWALVGGAGLAATTSAYDGGGASYAGGAPKGCGVHGVGGCRRREGVGGGDGGGGSAMVL